MTRLDPAAFQAHQLALEAWQSPEDLHARAVKIMDEMGKDCFVQPGLTFVREAWVAGRFGSARGARAVRLAPGGFPDFEMRFGGDTGRWEVTEADDEERKRSAEYREGKPRESGSDYIALIERAPDEIRRVCALKAANRYAEKVSLLVYLNIPSFGARQRETVESFPYSTAPAKDAFSEVWVLWDDRAYAVWREGRIASAA